MIASVAVCSNRPRYLSSTIAAICAQRYSDFELIIVDQSTTGDTAQAISERRDSRIRHIPDSGIGLNRARNIALQHARGKIIAFTDDDCMPSDTWLENLISRYQQEPDLCLLAGPLLLPKNAKLGVFAACPHSSMSDELWRGGATIPPGSSIYQAWGGNISYNREMLLSKVGWFDTYFDPGARFGMCGDDDMRRRIIAKKLTVGTCASATVEHTFGLRTGRAYFRQIATSAYALGALLAKHQLLAASCLENAICEIEPCDRLSPIARLKHIIRSRYIRSGFRDCRNHFDVDKEHAVLIPKNSNYHSVYGNFLLDPAAGS